MFKDFFSAGTGAAAPIDFSALPANGVKDPGKITKFYSDRKDITPEQKELIKAIPAKHNKFSTNLLGNPQSEIQPNFFQRVKATYDEVNGRWKIDKILHLSPTEDASAELQDISTPVSLGIAKYYLDALEFIANYETYLLKSGQSQIIPSKGIVEETVPHWSEAAEETGQPTDLDGWLRPSALGSPLIEGAYFNKKQMKVMAKTAPMAKKKPGLLDNIFSSSADGSGTGGQVISAARATELATQAAAAEEKRKTEAIRTEAERKRAELAKAVQNGVYSRIVAAQDTPLLRDLREKGYMIAPEKGDFRIDVEKINSLFAIDRNSRFERNYIETMQRLLETASDAETGHFYRCDPKRLTQIYNVAAKPAPSRTPVAFNPNVPDILQDDHISTILASPLLITASTYVTSTELYILLGAAALMAAGILSLPISGLALLRRLHFTLNDKVEIEVDYQKSKKEYLRNMAP